jgi:hypothetical protein
MIAIILTVCLAAAPEICRDEQPPIAVISEIQCVMQGQQIAAEWIGDHPKYELRRWRCGRKETPT